MNPLVSLGKPDGISPIHHCQTLGQSRSISEGASGGRAERRPRLVSGRVADLEFAGRAADLEFDCRQVQQAHALHGCERDR
jgi:hypothetical protein